MIRAGRFSETNTMRNVNYDCAAPQARCVAILQPDADGFCRGEILLEDEYPLGVTVSSPREHDNNLAIDFCSLCSPYWRCAVVLRRIIKFHSWNSDFLGELVLSRRFYEVGLLVLQQERVALRLRMHAIHLHKNPLRTISVATAGNNSPTPEPKIQQRPSNSRRRPAAVAPNCEPTAFPLPASS
jgi:hypothetical protein